MLAIVVLVMVNVSVCGDVGATQSDVSYWAVQ